MDQKNLDELFRDKFKAFREVPDEKVWTAIENSLDKKPKKRVIPLWWKLGGVAAVLAIALIALYPFGDTAEENPAVTDTENTNLDGTDQDKLDSDTKDGPEDAFPIPGTTDTETNAASPKTKKTQLTANERAKNRKDADRGDTTEEYGPILKKDSSGLIENRNTDAFATTGADKSEKIGTSKMDIKAKNQNGVKDGIAVTQEGTRINSGQEKDKVAQNDIATEGADKAADGKKSIFEALEEQADEENIAEESGSRWSAGPSIAPVYFDAMGEGSPIDPGFSPNSKSGSTNLSYGLSVAYAINNKLSVRSGIHKAEYGYDTNDVGFSPTLAASSSGRLQNIEYAGGPENLAVNYAVSNSGNPNDLASEFSTLNSARDGTVAQSFGYLEVPLELDYALIDRKFGVNLVGGVSSLFLLDNSVTLSSGELTAEIGEARNLNDFNFSTNIGFGINYKFTPKIQLNIEPVFKYQLNTFSNTSGDFRPYSIGVYSGLNFKF